MPLKQCNHSASLLVYQQDSHQCPGANSVRVIFFLWIVQVNASQNIQRSGTRSVSLERTVLWKNCQSVAVHGEKGANAEASDFDLVSTSAIPHYGRMWKDTSQQNHTINPHNQQGHAVKEPRFQLLKKYQKSAQEFHGPYSWSQSRFQGLGQAHCSVWSCESTESKLDRSMNTAWFPTN